MSMVRKYAPGLILLLVTVFVTIYTVLQDHDTAAMIAAMHSIEVSYLFLAAGLALMPVVLEGVVIRLLLHTKGTAAGLPACICWACVGFLFSGITPSATGGQPVQIYYMKQRGIRVSDSTPVLMIAAILYKFVLVVLGAGLWLFWRNGIIRFFGNYLVLFYLGMILNAAVVTALIILMIHPTLVWTVVSAAEQGLVRMRIVGVSAARQEKLQQGCREYQQAVHFFAGSRRPVAAALLITLMQRLCSFGVMAALFRGFGLTGVPVWTVAALQAAVTLAVDLLPLPGAAGITELVSFTVYRTVFTGSYLAAGISLLRGISFYLVLVISLLVFVWTYIAGKRKQMGVQALPGEQFRCPL